MRNIDFNSWQGLFTTLVGLALVTLIGVGIRLLMMLTLQQRRERMNRQINERLRTLIAAYKTLGGSFTGDLAVDPRHFRDLHQISDLGGEDTNTATVLDLNENTTGQSARKHRIRDAVEAALSDIILLGTEEHVRLAERAASELIAGRPVHTHELVVSLRNFIRKALDLDPIPSDLVLPMQGPARPSSSGGRSKDERGKEGTREKGRGMSAGGGMGIGVGASSDAEDSSLSDDHQTR